MKPIFKLRDLLQQDNTTLSATSTLLGTGAATLDCTDVDILAPVQMELLLAEIPTNWGFSDLREVIQSNSLSDSLANQISQWMLHQAGQSKPEDVCASGLTLKNLDRVLVFLPILETAIAQKDSRLYEVNPQANPFSPYIYAREVNRFIQVLYDEGFILHSFDWGVWLEEANRYVAEPIHLDSADLVTLQKLMTTHIRAEKFKSGHLAQILDNGHLLIVLNRLCEIREELLASSSQSREVGIFNRIRVIRGDLTQQPVDAIVNSTDLSLEAEEGVSGAIFRTAGLSLKEECRKLRGCAIGQAKLTRGYDLFAHWIIHTVGPIWQGGHRQEDRLLAQCYHNSLALAALCPIQTIAFPAISVGRHQFPADRAAKIAIAEVYQFLRTNTSLEQVFLVCSNGEVFNAYIQAFKEVKEQDV
jgi:O-acetyl-ADP-ribose deacetylase (regulator of RNase III)